MLILRILHHLASKSLPGIRNCAYMSWTSADPQSGGRSANYNLRGRGRGGKRWGDLRDKQAPEQQKKAPQQSRPTHCAFSVAALLSSLMIISDSPCFTTCKRRLFGPCPLSDSYKHTHQRLRECVASYQSALMGDPIKAGGKGNPAVSSLVDGLDTSIIIDPRRLHLTLGVMALDPVDQEQPSLDHQPSLPESSTNTPPVVPKKTVETALELLESLQPRISEILGGSTGVKVLLDHLDVLKTQKIRTLRSPGEGPELEEGPPKVGAGVLFLGPSPSALQSVEGVKLMRVCSG